VDILDDMGVSKLSANVLLSSPAAPHGCFYLLLIYYFITINLLLRQGGFLTFSK